MNSKNCHKKRKYSKTAVKKMTENKINEIAIRNNNAIVETMLSLESIINKLITKINGLESINYKMQDQIARLESVINYQYPPCQYSCCVPATNVITM